MTAFHPLEPVSGSSQPGIEDGAHLQHESIGIVQVTEEADVAGYRPVRTPVLRLHSRVDHSLRPFAYRFREGLLVRPAHACLLRASFDPRKIVAPSRRRRIGGHANVAECDALLLPANSADGVAGTRDACSSSEASAARVSRSLPRWLAEHELDG